MSRGESFVDVDADAATNGDSYADDASHQDVEAPTREELYRELQRLQERVSELEEEQSASHSTHALEIESYSRMPDRRELPSNSERAVRIWTNLPHHSTVRRDTLVMDHEDLARAISDVDPDVSGRPHYQTVSRVREKLQELSEYQVRVEDLERGGSTKKRVKVSKKAWCNHREDDVVREYFPEMLEVEDED